MCSNRTTQMESVIVKNRDCSPQLIWRPKRGEKKRREERNAVVWKGPVSSLESEIAGNSCQSWRNVDLMLLTENFSGSLCAGGPAGRSCVAQQTRRELAAGTITNTGQEHGQKRLIRARATAKIDGITAKQAYTLTHTHIQIWCLCYCLMFSAVCWKL